ncbi:hypothetical protein SDC9_145568 [bioreactor metagenome]|uniref:N-acetylglucosamine kinase n=1 Tax=bioreactor metagenome TaxID=1076179 RepID=A0A645ECJ7_9ZZZZ
MFKYLNFNLADELIDQLYIKPSANRFCAKFSRFVGDNLQRNEYYRKIVYDSFYDLFNNIIVHYPRYRNYTFNCVGSIAYHFQPILEDVVSDYGMKMGKIEKEPMKGLVEFHLKNNRL